MRTTFLFLAITIATQAIAEVQDVKAGGSLRIRGNWYSESDRDFDNDNSNDLLYIEQRSTINVTASLTDNVNAFAEFDYYSNWGDQFRGVDSDGIVTGADGVGTAGDEAIQAGRGFPVNTTDGSLALYQGYIEIKEVWGSPISVRLGRQEIQLNSEFLVGNNNTGSNFRGLSFDAFTTRTDLGDFQLRTMYSMIVRNNNPLRLESSGDTWFNGIQGSYVGFEGMTIDLYGVRYYQAKTDVTQALGYVDHISFITIGAHFSGKRAQFDWDVEGAYQFGDSGLPDVAGVSSEDINTFAGTAKAGYTFDVKTQPRIFLNGAYFNGDDEEPAFNRLFSDYEYSEFIDATDLTNVWTAGGGVGIQATDTIALTAVANYFQAVEDFGADDNQIGIEVGLYASYDYSEDLSFTAGYAHFFAGDGIEDGQRVVLNGTGTLGGLGEADDMDYVFVETRIKF